MQFQTPQFIETEDKIFGPLTLKQLLYLASAGVLIFIANFFLAFWVWVFFAAVAGSLGAALAFVKYHGRPLAKVLFLALGFLWKPRLFLWKREIKDKFYEMPDDKILSQRNNLGDNFKTGAQAIKKLLTDLITKKEPIAKREKKSPQTRYAVFRKMTGDKQAARRVDYR